MHDSPERQPGQEPRPDVGLPEVGELKPVPPEFQGKKWTLGRESGAAALSCAVDSSIDDPEAKTSRAELDQALAELAGSGALPPDEAPGHITRMLRDIETKTAKDEALTPDETNVFRGYLRGLQARNKSEHGDEV